MWNVRPAHCGPQPVASPSGRHHAAPMASSRRCSKAASFLGLRHAAGTAKQRRGTVCRAEGSTDEASALRKRLRGLMNKLGMDEQLPPIQTPVPAASVSSMDDWGSSAPFPSSSGGAATASPPSSPRGPAIINANRDPTDWGSPWQQDWDPEQDLDEEQKELLSDEMEASFRKPGRETPRDKWITPLLDFGSVAGAVDPDQERTEENLEGEALANKEESLSAIRYAAQLITLPLATGFIISRTLADPVLNYTLQNNEEAFAMTDRQKVEGAAALHLEEAKVRMDIAIGRAPPLTEEAILEHLVEYAHEVEEEERHHNEQTLITVVSDSISAIVLFSMLVQPTRGRRALFNTWNRLFEGLSDIAKAVLIILIADTLLGYHSEEGWTGLFELVAGRYGVEAEETGVVIFVGTVPVIIDVFFKYWIFIGLNKISPGAVVTIKQIDTH